MSSSNAPLWDASTYDAKHSFVTQYGDAVLELLNPQPGETILDVGCGTGSHAGKISSIGAKVTGIDKDPLMLALVQAKYPEIEFIQADAASWRREGAFDKVFSNAALHWMDDLDSVFRNIAASLKPKGWFVFEMGGKGNVRLTSGYLLEAIKELCGKDGAQNKNYLSVGEVAALLEPIGFRLEQTWEFDRPTPLEGPDGLANWYRQFGVWMLAVCPEELREKAIELAVERAKKDLFKEGTWVSDYVRLRVKARLQ
jgi:trans-aconitate methyltransferase